MPLLQIKSQVADIKHQEIEKYMIKGHLLKGE